MKRRHAVSTIMGGAALCVAPRLVSAADATIRIALLPVDSAACVYYAKDLGYFEDVGINAEVQVIQAGSAIVAAILSNVIDIGWSNPISVAAAHLRGLPIVAIAAGGVYARHEATAALVVPKNSQIKNAHDFSGKTLACSGLKTLGQIAPAAWIDKNGGDSRQVQFVEMPFPDMPLALSQERVDSAFPAEPFVTMAKNSSRFFADAFGAIAPRFEVGVWVTTQQWADAHRDLVGKFAQVMAKTAAWANGHRDQSAVILSKYSKLDLSIVKTMLRQSYATGLAPGDMQPVLDAATHYGALPTSLSANQLIFKG